MKKVENNKIVILGLHNSLNVASATCAVAANGMQIYGRVQQKEYVLGKLIPST
jgi:hypothetical protein